MSDTLAAVLTKEPDWDRVPASARHLLTRCLEKDPKRRLRNIGDAAFLVDEGVSKTGAAAKAENVDSVGGGGSADRRAGVSAVILRPQSVNGPLVRFDLDLGGEVPVRALGGVAFSPDGARLAVSVNGPEGQPVLRHGASISRTIPCCRGLKVRTSRSSRPTVSQSRSLPGAS